MPNGANMLTSNTTFSISACRKNISPQVNNVSTVPKITEFDQQYESKPNDQSEPILK